MPSEADKRRAYYDAYTTGMGAANVARTRERCELAIQMLGARRGRLLSVGATALAEAAAFKDAGFDVTVCDISPVALERAKRDLGVKTLEVDLEQPAMTGEWDAIACLEVLEHLHHGKDALVALLACLASDGRAVVSLPNEFHVVRRLQVLFGRVDFSVHDWHHVRFFTPRSARQLMALAGGVIEAEMSTPIVPPRMAWLRPVGKALAKLRPTLFGMSTMFLLRRP